MTNEEMLQKLEQYRRADRRIDLVALRQDELRAQGRDDNRDDAFFDAVFGDDMAGKDQDSELMKFARAENARVVREQDERQEREREARDIEKLRAGTTVSTGQKYREGEELEVWGFLCRVTRKSWWREAEEEEIHQYTGWMTPIKLVEPIRRINRYGNWETHASWETEEHLAAIGL